MAKRGAEPVEQSLDTPGGPRICPKHVGWWPASYWFGALALVAFFGEASITGTLLPFFLEDVLHAESSWVGIALTTQYAAASVGQILTGILADAIGHQLVLTVLMIANTALLNLQGRCTSVGALLVVRSLMGFATPYALALTWIARTAHLAHLAKAMANSVVVAQIAVGVGGIIAGLLRGHDFDVACWILSIAPMANAVFLLGAWSPGTAVEQTGHSNCFYTVAEVMCIPPFAVVLWCIFCHGCYMGFCLTIPPFVLKEVHGLPESAVGHTFQLAGFLTVLCHLFITSPLSARMPGRSVQCLAVLLGALVALLGSIGQELVWSVYALTVVSYCANFVSLGCCNYLVMLAAKKYRPKAVAMMNGVARCMFTVGAGVTPAGAEYLRSVAGTWLPCIVLVVFCMCSAILISIARLPAKLPPPPKVPQRAPTNELGLGPDPSPGTDLGPDLKEAMSQRGPEHQTVPELALPASCSTQRANVSSESLRNDETNCHPVTLDVPEIIGKTSGKLSL